MTELYKRQTRFYEFNVTADEITGKEVYIRHDDAAGGIAYASLPLVGTTPILDPSGSAVGTCLCRSRRATYEGGDVNSVKWEFTYATGKNSPPSDNIEEDKAARRYDLGTQTTAIDKANPSEVGPRNQRVVKLNAAGTFSIPTGDMAGTRKDSFITLVESMAGKINHSAFEGHRQGSVMFEGVSGGTKYNSNGQLRWLFEMRFTFKILQGAINTGGNVASMDWNYDLNTDGKWELIKVDGTGWYGTADFSSLTGFALD